MSPAGDAGSFRQVYDLHETHVDTDAAVIEVGGRRFTLGRDFVLRSFMGTIDGPLPVVYVSHGWVVPGKGIDPYAGLDVRGKLVLAHGPRAMPKGVEIQHVGRTAINAQTPFVAAAERGAAGVLFITQASELVRWDELRGANTVRREMEPAVPSAYLATPITSVLLAPPVTEALLNGEALDGRSAIRAGDEGVYPAPFALKKSVTVRLAPGARTVLRPYNVVAKLARGPRPRRSVIFIWDSGEEQGLWGTRWFVHRPAVPLTRIVAHVNVDMIGASRSPGGADALSADVTERGEVFVLGPRVLSASADALLARVNG